MAREPWLDRLGMPYPTFEPARFDDECERMYGDVMDVLATARVPYLLAGAFALNVHTGIWRSTKDLDFFLRPRDLAAAHAALRAAGYEIDIVDPVWLSKAVQADNGVFVDLIHQNANGLFPVDDSWYEHAVAGEVWGRRVLVAPAEEVILSKMFVAARERFDGADVLHLIHRTGGKLDWARLLAKAGSYAGLLLAYLHLYRFVYPADAGLVPKEVLSGAARRAEEARREAAAGGLTFRGTLLDPVQLSIDVRAFGLADERAAVRAAAVRGPGPATEHGPAREAEAA